MLDLRRKGNLTPADNLWICSAAQAVLLDEIFKVTGWSGEDATFHGGTSIKFAWGSPRFSEDLDFMVSNERLDQLAGLADEVAKRAVRRIGALTPGASVAFKANPQRPGRDRMDTWDVRWSHPMRHGVAKVKCEFYAVLPGMLRLYRGRTVAPVPGGGGVRMTAPVPVADLVSLWGDKVKAIATRPEFKMRDAHDLGFVSRQFEATGGRPSDEELREALVTTAGIYGKTPEEVAEGVEARLSDGTMDRTDDYMRDMVRWFDAATYASLEGQGLLTDYWRRTADEMRIGVELLRAASPSPGGPR